jgi:hypothetical protein
MTAEDYHNQISTENWDFMKPNYRIAIERVAYVKTNFVYKMDLLFFNESVVLDRKKVLGRVFTTRELVWMFHNGLIPKNYKVVQIDGCLYNNRISNLTLQEHIVYQSPESKAFYRRSYMIPEDIGNFLRKKTLIKALHAEKQRLQAKKKQENKELLLFKKDKLEKLLKIRKINPWLFSDLSSQTKQAIDLDERKMQGARIITIDPETGRVMKRPAGLPSLKKRVKEWGTAEFVKAMRKQS